VETVLKKEIILNRTLIRLLGVAVFTILTALGAFVRIPLPFTPVPLTLQTFFVLLSGACLGANLGALSQLSYIILGVVGLPIFTNAGSGLFYLFGPTGGYLLGFVLASLLVGRLIKSLHQDLFSLFLILFLGDLLLLSCGTIWLGIIFGYPLRKLLFLGFFPFIPGDLLKALAASMIYLQLQSRLKEIFSNEDETYGAPACRQAG
jgi:biotin transport system substrate-specific component